MYINPFIGLPTTRYFLQLTDYFWTNGPEIFLGIICLINLILVSVSYFGRASTWNLKYKFLSLRLVQFNVQALVVVLFLYAWHILTGTIYITNPIVAVDWYVTFFKILIISTTIFIVQNSYNYILHHLNPITEYCFVMVLACFFLVLLVSSTSLIFMVFCIFGFSLCLYVLTMYDTPYKKSYEATTKYFYLSAVSSAAIIAGTALIYYVLHTTAFFEISYLLFVKTRADAWREIILVDIGIITIFIGLAFKLAVFPCHLWAPEVYEGSPNPVMGFFILPVKIAVLAIFIKLFSSVFHELHILWKYTVWSSAAASMIYGCAGAYNENSIKKFMAYSSINQIGFLLIGVVAGTFESTQATVLYLLIYIAMNLCFLQLYLNSFYVDKSQSIEFLSDLKYFAQTNWRLSLGIAVFFFSMAGIPPLAGFFGKYLLFLAAFKSGDYSLIIIGMTTSLISTYYYLRVIKVLWFEYSPFDLNLLYKLEASILAPKLTPNELKFYSALITILVFFVLCVDVLYYLTASVIYWC